MSIVDKIIPKDLYKKILNAVVEFRNDHPYEIDEQSEDISEEENL